jgi:DNA gyrase subunit A
MRKKIDTTAIAAVQEKIGKEEIQKLLDENYMRYTFSVMEDRALPDARDGLKPSQRRILYAMHTLGLASNKSRVKSALICGETSGRYHPHGESVVYPTMVRLAQDFSMRYPLISKQGNFGNLDGDPPAAMRYCIIGSSLLNTENGLVQIQDVSKNEDIDILVSSVGNKINSASKFFNCGKHPIKRVITRHGYTEAGSYNHPLLVIARDPSGKPVFGWKTLDTIKPGDFVLGSK